MERFVSTCEQETRDIAKNFAKTLGEGSVVALIGDLGAGKTAFTKGVAEFFGIDDDVSSPTFTIVNEYSGEKTVYHFDAYRLENVKADDCDWLDDYFFGDGICLVEWAQNIESVLPQGYFKVEIKKDPSKGNDYREIFIEKTEK